MANRGRVLDTFYIPSRYPNGHPEGAPFERRAAEWDPTELPVPADVLVYAEDEWRSLDPRRRFHATVTREAIWAYNACRERPR